MLYVFLVDNGTMFTFEMELAMESVETLMKTITSMFMIPIEKQVLIMEGGEALDPSQRICNYSSAGTENNPIFLFSKSTIESHVPPSASLNLGSETTLKEEVELSLKLPPTYETLVSRAHLASRFQEMAVELSQSCISMVNEQYLQRQGWIAVIANLENIASTFHTRATLLEQNYSDFLKLIPQYNTLLDRFPQVIILLSKIPVFHCLLQNKMDTLVSKETDVTLLDWINAQDRKNDLQDMVQQCVDFLEQIQKFSLHEIQEDRDQVLEDVSNKNMKEIGGLEERLNLLSKLCENSRKLAQEQSDMAQGFSQNQIRAQNIGDPSVLPDLCSSHQKQLSLLMNNHSQLRDIRRRCAKAKDELSGNLHARLRWVMMIEKKICDRDNKLVLYHESMKRIKKHVEILEQIERAPRFYALAVEEVVRRRDFASHFIKWAKTIAYESERKYKDEVARRHKFSKFVGQHFLQSLFIGIDDMPTPFARTAPELFDTALPPISSKELKDLVLQVPELLTLCLSNEEQNLGAKENIPSFVGARSLSCDDLPTIKQFDVETSVDEISQTSTVCARENLTKYNESKDENKSESRETPDYGKPENVFVEEINVSDLPSKEIGDKDKTTSILKQTERTKTERENGYSKIILSNLSVQENALKNINEIREDLAKFLLATCSWRKDVDEYFCEQIKNFEQFQVSERTEKHLKETRSVDESETMSDDIKTIRRKVNSLTAENESLRKELKTKEKTFAEKALKYRTELKEQKRITSEIESSKEKIEADQQIRFNSVINKVMKEKDAALKKANEQLSESRNLKAKNEEKLQILFNEKEELRIAKEKKELELVKAVEEFSTKKLELEKNLLDARKNLEEKEKVLETGRDEGAMTPHGEEQGADALGSGQIFSELVVERFHQRIKHLEEENGLLKSRLESGPDGSDKILFVELQQSLDEKSKECDALKTELELLQQRPRSSQVVFKDFQKGDIVQVYFNEEFGLHMVQSTGNTLHFVHPDSLVNLGIQSDLSQISTFQAQVLDKEYCQAKKDNNRFKVAVGTKFYRVKLRCWTPPC